ncbi:efflux RND transporter periplasmic adaptor subunit [Salegentibacter salegens]|uniref:RND family efflux transporter, MFP subunit n=1 Tax=Salegentibacter salegens TaxID=143223 RepID=A0A1M7KPQ9_9FLAO|nr:efflux RND transporter periplasmic adaptor subunit [Salegentibacter salegens]PRX48857.1 RND family efflux transporter MFP subunit [Salegentibacter salegens]SHM67436.1 RND family efflux transporter, MFP subunit [Salegentibacter salegens]
MSTKKILIICLGILLLAAIVTYFIFSTEPTASSEGATKQTAMLVDVVQADAGDFRPVIEATGMVQPVEDVILSPQVSGQIISRSPEFIPGGFVQKGAALLQIDPSDFRNTLELRRSDLLQAQTNLNMEMGRQEVAEQDLELAGIDSLSANQRSLVLRKPQLDAIRAQVKAAEASVAQAELELSRTTIKAPFDAHILSQNVTVGSQVSPGDELGRLVGSEQYWITLTVPVNKLQWLSFPKSEEETGSTVEIRNSGWPKGVFRVGYLDQQVGALDEQTRLARVLVRVNDPLAREDTTDTKRELMIGGFVEAQVQAREVENVVRLNRDYLRTNQTVWVNEDGELSIREVEIILTDSEYAYISQGLSEGEEVVTTNLSVVSEGVKLRKAEPETTSGNNNEQEPNIEE